MYLRGVGLALAIAIALLSPAPARSDWPPEGRLVSTVGASSHDHVRLFRDPSGDAVVVWRLRSEFSTCRAQRVTAAGAIAAGWPDEGVGFSARSYFDAVSDDAGGAFNAYVSSNYDVYLEHALGDASRTPSSGPGWPVAETSQTEWYPAVTPDGAGGAYVAWLPGTSSIYLRRLQSDGSLAPGWPATGVAVNAGVYFPQVAIASPALLPDGTGGIYVMWLADKVRVQRLTLTGEAAGWPAAGIEFGSEPPELFSSPLQRLIPSGADHAYVAWVDRFYGADWTRLFLARFHRSGAAAGPVFPVILTSDPVSSIALVPDGQEGVTIVWEQQSLPLMLHYGPGVVVGPVSPLDPGAQYVPGTLFAATGADGGVIVSWTDARPFFRREIRARWFRADGSPDPREPSTARRITPVGTLATNRGMVDDGNGGAYIAWQDDTQGHLLRLSHAPGTAVVGVGPAGMMTTGLELRPPAPNPAGREITLGFVLAGDAPGRIELIDLAGRLRRSLEVRGAGEQMVRLGGLDALPPGLYFVRLTQGALARTSRVVIAH